MALIMTGCSTVVVQQSPKPGGNAHPVVAASPQGTYTVAKGDTLYSIAFRNGTDFRDVARLNNIAPPYTIWPGQVLKLSDNASTLGHATSVVAKAPQRGTAATISMPASRTAASVPSTNISSHPAQASSAAIAPSAAPSPSTTSVGSTPSTVGSAPILASGSTHTVSGVKWRWPATGSVVSRFQANAAIPGIDIAGKEGEPVVAAADGVVVYSGNGLVGYGELIIIKHNDSFLSAYGHNRKRLVTEGQHVKAGQQIAEMGSSGGSRDELQFQIRKDGSPVDPLDYLPAR